MIILQTSSVRFSRSCNFNFSSGKGHLDTNFTYNQNKTAGFSELLMKSEQTLSNIVTFNIVKSAYLMSNKC